MQKESFYSAEHQALLLSRVAGELLIIGQKKGSLFQLGVDP